MSMPYFAARDGAVPAEPSELACHICGEFALARANQCFPDRRAGRLICRVCGAHHLSRPAY